MKRFLPLLLLAMSCLGATTAYYYNGRMIGSVGISVGTFTNALFVYTALSGGNDFNDGFTPQTPLLHGSVACAKLTNGVRCTVYFENGATLSDTNWLIPNIGQASAPFRFTTYGPSPATINFSVRSSGGTQPNVWESRNPAGINVSNANCISFDNLILSGVGASTSNSSDCIKLIHMNVTGAPVDYGSILLSNVVMRGWAAGLTVWPLSNRFGFTNLTVTHCALTNNNHIGMTMRSLDDPPQSPLVYPVLTRLGLHNVTIVSNEVGSMYGFSDNGGLNRIPTPLALSSCDGFLIQGNWIHDSGTNYNGVGIGGAGIEVQSSKNGIVYGNLASNIWATLNPGHKTIDGMGIDVDGQDTWVVGNTSVDCYGPGFQSSFSWGGVHYEFNLSLNCGRGSTATEPVGAMNFNLVNSGLVVMNNTIIGTRVSFPANPSGGIMFGDDDGVAVLSGTNIVANNLVYLYGATNVVQANAGCTNFLFFTNNAYWDGAWGDKLKFRWGGVDYTGLTAWRAVGGDKGGWMTNGPLFLPEVVSPNITVANMRQTSTNYWMSTNSPLWKHAANLQGMFGINITNDFAGNALTPSSFSVGAFDTNNEPPPTPGSAVPTGLYAEFVADDIWTNNSQFISNWKDRRTGNGWLLQAPTSGSTVYGPTIIARSLLNGHLQVNFDGIGSFLTNSTLTNFFASRNLDILISYRNIGTYDGTANNYFILDGYGSTNRVVILEGMVSGDTTTNFWNVASGQGFMDSRTGTNFNETLEMIVTNGGFQFRTNNVICLEGTATNAGWYGATIGARFGPTASSFINQRFFTMTIWTNDNRGLGYSPLTNYLRGMF